MRSSRPPVLPVKGRTMASTEKDATRPAPACTRHSAWVMPSPANVDRWWYSIHSSARTGPCNDRLMALIPVDSVRCACVLADARVGAQGGGDRHVAR